MVKFKDFLIIEKLKRGFMEFRKSTLNERKEFYEKEFSIAKVKAWFKKNSF